jgi:hypothetical protein
MMHGVQHPRRSADQAAAADPAAQLSRLLDRVYDVETGLIRFIAEIPRQADEPPLHLAVAEHQNPFLVAPRALDLSGNGLPETSLMGTGAALDRVSALWSTVGEAIERYALHVYDREAIAFACPHELDAPAVTPDQMILFDKRQYARTGFPFVPYDASQRIGWTKGINLATGRDVWLPAILSYLAYRIISPAELLDSGYSTGGAAGPSLAAAYHSGLLEVIERDGFACHWYLRRTPPEIDAADYVDDMPSRFVDLLRSAKLKLRFFDLTTDLGVPTVLALGLPNGGGIAIGAIDFIVNGERPQRLPAGPWPGVDDDSRLAGLVDRLCGHGYPAYGLDLTPEEIAGEGLYVGRSFVPGLHPLGSGAGNEHGDLRRLRRFSQATGLPTPIAINLDPHPFP